MIDELYHEGKLLGIIIRNEYRVRGISFFTPDDFSQQLAYLNHPAGKVIPPHVHNKIAREVHLTQEILFLKRGRLQIDFYDDQQRYVESRVLHPGDAVLLASGGHGFTVLDEIEMFEVKQGPYAGEQDKTNFPGVPQGKHKIKE